MFDDLVPKAEVLQPFLLLFGIRSVASRDQDFEGGFHPRRLVGTKSDSSHRAIEVHKMLK